MFRKTIQIELPRRVAAYYLLFCTVAVAWASLGLFVVAQAVLRTRAENACIAALQRGASVLELQYVRHGVAGLQPAVERIRHESGLLWCAVSTPEHRFAAHTAPAQLEQTVPEPLGQRTRLEKGIERIRFLHPDAQLVREYRMPLQRGSDVIGTLHVAMAEPNAWGTAYLTARHAAVGTLAAGLFLGLGAVVVYRTVRPMADIDRQLCEVARRGSCSNIQLEPVQQRTPSALGWNYLVDATGRQREQGPLEDRLQQALTGLGRQKADEILHSLTDGIAVADEEGRVTFANHALASILDRGGNPELLIGARMEELLELHQFDDEDVQALLDATLKPRSVCAQICSPHAGETVLRVVRTPLRVGERRAPAGHVWTVRDVTQQKLAERARDEFLDAATHELRTPLANIKAYAETLALSEMMEVEQQKEFCNTINTEASRLARFIDDLLSVSSMEAGSLTLALQEVNVERLLREAIGKVKPQMDKKQIAFEVTLPEKLPELLLDKDKFVSALINLLGNAAKYTPEGGRVALTVRDEDQRLHVDVQDSGMGISEEELPKVFDKFFRSSDERVRNITGTGLGLSFAQEVVRLHGGKLTVQSQLDKGSTFSMVLPMVQRTPG